MDTLILRQVPKATHTQVHFGHESLYSPAWLQILKSFKGPLGVISDKTVKPLFVDKWVEFLKKEGLTVFQWSFPSGEASKTQETKAFLEEQLLTHACGKQTLLIAVGGGVTTDLVSYLASTFYRGISFCAIPTTLLCMVDAAIGGKTGINTPFGKNLIGTFHPAEQIFVDTALLATLPEREWRNGLAEVIKYALIKSPSLFETLKTAPPLWEQKDSALLKSVIKESCQIKKQVVESDFQETGYRRILNFGHTIAHAIERLSHYQIPHGEAVALGMLVEMELSYRLGGPSLQEVEALKQILQRYGFPLTFPSFATVDTLAHAMQWDKKSIGSTPRFVLLQEIGRVKPFDGAYCSPIDATLLKSTLLEFILVNV